MEIKDLIVNFLKSENLLETEFADLISMSDQAVCKWCRGDAVPSQPTLLAIKKKTKGKLDILYELYGKRNRSDK